MQLTFVVPAFGTNSFGIIKSRAEPSRAEPMSAPRVRRGTSSCRSDSASSAAPAGARPSDTPRPRDASRGPPAAGAVIEPAGLPAPWPARRRAWCWRRSSPCPCRRRPRPRSGRPPSRRELLATWSVATLAFAQINAAMDCASSSVLSDDEFTHDTTTYLITYEAQLPASGPGRHGVRRLRDDRSGWIDPRFALSNDPPTAIDHRVRVRAEDCA